METDRDAAERERRQERQLSLLYLLAILLSCLLAAVVLLDSPKYGPTEFFTMSAPITYGERDLLDAPVNLNTADAAELDLLPGIGETLDREDPGIPGADRWFYTGGAAAGGAGHRRKDSGKTAPLCGAVISELRERTRRRKVGGSF